MYRSRTTVRMSPPCSSLDELEEEEPTDCEDQATGHWDNDCPSPPMRGHGTSRAMEMELHQERTLESSQKDQGQDPYSPGFHQFDTEHRGPQNPSPLLVPHHLLPWTHLCHHGSSLKNKVLGRRRRAGKVSSQGYRATILTPLFFLYFYSRGRARPMEFQQMPGDSGR